MSLSSQAPKQCVARLPMLGTAGQMWAGLASSPAKLRKLKIERYEEECREVTNPDLQVACNTHRVCQRQLERCARVTVNRTY